MYCEIKEKVSSLEELEQFKAAACLSLRNVIFNGMYIKVLEKIYFFFPAIVPIEKHTESHRPNKKPLRATDTVFVIVHIYFNTALYISNFTNIFSAYSTDGYNHIAPVD